MDQKTYPNLNPKLKETYDRIMGTATTAASPAPSHTSPASHPAPNHPQASPHNNGHLSHLAYNASTAHKKEKAEPAPTNTAGVKSLKGDSLIMPIIFAAAGVAFFVVYAIFWMNFFGLNQ